MIETSRPTRAWYIAPILFSILGGIIGYLAVRKKDKQLANRLLILGIIVFVIAILVDAYFFAATMSP
jgi:hypothetical protein